jgi:magnesium transporter
MPDQSRQEQVKSLIERRDWARLREYLAGWEPPELADLLLNLGKQERVLLFRALPRQQSAEAFAYLEPDEQDVLLKQLTDEETRHLLAGLRPDDRTHLLEELPAQATRRLLNLLSPEDLAEARQLLGYPEESVGRLMTPDYIAVRPDSTVAQALAHIRTHGRDSETVNRVYVTDAGGVLLDDIRLRRFILADPNERVEQLMDRNYISLSAFDDREKAVEAMQRYDVFALPVVDTDGVLLGIVTSDDVLDVAQEEATEDFHRVAAVAPLKTDYSEASIWSLYRKRIGWLVALVLVNLVSSEVIATYEATLSATIALVFFIPLLIASGGNAGAQSATLIVRAIATEDVKRSQWMRALLKELFVGVSLALTMGLASWTLGLYRGGFDLAIVVAVAMLAIIIVTNLMGAALPFILHVLRMDPAVASAPLVTSLADVVGLLIYFAVAAWMLR